METKTAEQIKAKGVAEKNQFEADQKMKDELSKVEAKMASLKQENTAMSQKSQADMSKQQQDFDKKLKQQMKQQFKMPQAVNTAQAARPATASARSDLGASLKGPRSQTPAEERWKRFKAAEQLLNAEEKIDELD